MIKRIPRFKKERPVYRERFENYRERLSRSSPIRRIDFIFVTECEMALSAYFGGDIRAGVSLLVRGIGAASRGVYWNCVYRVCDRIGWTQLRPIPGTDAFERHGRGCDKMNCQDMDCVQRGIPGWYKTLTRMEGFGDL